jgi:hypothetical protein
MSATTKNPKDAKRDAFNGIANCMGRTVALAMVVTGKRPGHQELDGTEMMEAMIVGVLTGMLTTCFAWNDKRARAAIMELIATDMSVAEGFAEENADAIDRDENDDFVRQVVH